MKRGGAKGNHYRSAPRVKDELFISHREATLLLEAALELGPQWFVPLYTFRHTGLRVNELVHVRVNDINAELGRIYVWTGKNKAGSKPVGCSCGGYRKNVAVRESIPLSSSLAQVLLGWIDFRALTPDDWILPSRKNRLRHMTTERLRQMFDEAAAEAGVHKVKNRSTHSLRHLLGTEVAAKTGNPYMVQAFLRHASTASSDAYVHRAHLEDAARQVAENIGRLTAPGL